jgi:hypothetical protein
MEKLLCTKCGGFGEVDGCPDCGKKLGVIEFTEEKDEKVFTILSDKVFIPSEFQFNTWSKSLLKESKPFLNNDIGFASYADALDKIHSTFVDGVLSTKSAVIVSPANFSKTVFAYSCMQHAIQHRLTVAPMIDTLELRRLMMLCAVNPTYRLYNRIDYDKYLTSHVLFVRVTMTEERVFSLPTIRELLDRRSRMGLPTHIISETSADELGSGYRGTNIIDLINVEQSSHRRPVLIQYMGGR